VSEIILIASHHLGMAQRVTLLGQDGKHVELVLQGGFVGMDDRQDETAHFPSQCE
jgi:hypothetical protein